MFVHTTGSSFEMLALVYCLLNQPASCVGSISAVKFSSSPPFSMTFFFTTYISDTFLLLFSIYIRVSVCVRAHKLLLERTRAHPTPCHRHTLKIAGDCRGRLLIVLRDLHDLLLCAVGEVLLVAALLKYLEIIMLLVKHIL